MTRERAGVSPVPPRPGRGRDLVRRLYYACAALALDPKRLAASWRALPHFVANAIRYWRRNSRARFPLRVRDLQFATSDRFAPAGAVPAHYFLQDLWAARRLQRDGIRRHTDVGSRLDGFIAHILPFCDVTYVDLRPLDLQIEGLTVRRGSITSLPFADDSIDSLSCLHVIEHIGLGRYGDVVDPDGHVSAARELARVLRPGAKLLLSTPVGAERLCFDAHRIFDPDTVLAMFSGLVLRSFALIDDHGAEISPDARFDDARRCVYGCGLFVFEKPARGTA